MGEVGGLLVVMVAVVAVMMLVIGLTPGRVGRPPDGLATRYEDPTGTPVALPILIPLLVGSMVSSGSYQVAVVGGGLLGVVLGLTTRQPFPRFVIASAASAIGAVVALVEAWQFIVGDGSSPFARSFRIILITVVLLSFTVGIVLRPSLSALVGWRGLSLFALIEIVTFMAGPGGADLMLLDGTRSVAYFLVAGGTGMLLGWAASEAVVGLAAVGVALTSFGLALLGYTSTTDVTTWTLALLGATVAATGLTTRATSRRGARLRRA